MESRQQLLQVIASDSFGGVFGMVGVLQRVNRLMPIEQFQQEEHGRRKLEVLLTEWLFDDPVFNALIALPVVAQVGPHLHLH